jgi:hypothetical protein
MSLTPEEIADLKTIAEDVIAIYGERDRLAKRYEEIYFMTNPEQPRGLDMDPNDVKTTISPSGRNDVTGLKRILDTGEIQIKVKQNGKTIKADKIEQGLKTILRVSSEDRLASVEKDENLSATLFGMNVLTAESVDDLIAAKTKDSEGNPKENVNRFVVRQLEGLRKRTPFLLNTVSAMQSYPEWGEYGLVGHVRKYQVRGNVLKERWGCTDPGIDIKTLYTVKDFLHYDKRLVWAEEISDPLYADTWMTDQDIAKLPVFVRYGGGSSLWIEPEKQLQPFLYAKAQGEWDKRENLFWTYLFTAVNTQGIPGPTLLRDPDDTTPLKIKFDQGVKVITAKGKLENMNVIDGDVIGLKNLMDGENARSTIQPEAFGGGADGTFSGYVMSMNASKLPTEDPKEGIGKVYRDAFLYILQRIKAETIENELISPQDIPDDIDIEVTIEPNLTQDDLRNAQVATNLLNSGADVSKEWTNTNVLKINNNEEMKDQIFIEKAEATLMQALFTDKQFIQEMITTVLRRDPQQNGTPTEAPNEVAQDGPMGETTGEQMQDQMPGTEAQPQTDAMIPNSQRA